MRVRWFATWQWKDVLRSVTFLSKWVHVVVWLLLTKWLLNISKVVRMLRKEKSGRKQWHTGKHWRVMMMPYSIRKYALTRLISSRWLPTERTREWVWASLSISLLLKEWAKPHRFLSRNHWIIWDSSRVGLYWARRLTMYSWVLVQTVVLKISVRLLLWWKVVRKRTT